MNEKPGILYVDDEEQNLLVFKSAMRRNYKVHTASSGRQGLRILRDEDIKVIVADQRMPQMTGVQFLEATLDEFSNCTRIILTGYSDLDAVINAINCGRVYEYVTKPWDEQALRLTLDRAIEHGELQSQNRQLVANLEERLAEQARTLDVFQRYVPASVVDQVLRSARTGGANLLEAEHRIVSVLFTDLVGFTAMSAQRDSKDVVRFLNRYFTAMNECVDANKGTVLQYLGDGLLAVFGAPLSTIDNPGNAVNCAFAMQERLIELNAELKNTFGVEAKIGIGINSGEVFVGNIGAAHRMAYTAIGDTVNVASRIADVAKLDPAGPLVDQSTAEAIAPDFELVPLDPVKVKGKEEPLELCRVISRR